MVSSASLQGSRRTSPQPPLRTITSQQCMAARRHHVLAAPLQTPPAAPLPSPFHFPTIIHPLHSHVIINITPRTVHIDMRHTSITVAYNLQMTQWPTRPTTPRLPPREDTSSHPLDCARSEGECRGSSIWPGPPGHDTQCTLPVRAVLVHLHPCLVCIHSTYLNISICSLVVPLNTL